MAVTYDLIATSTPSGSTTATFNSLGSYTDLIIQCYTAGSGTGDVYLRFNGDSGANYYYLQGSSTATNTFDNASSSGASSIPVVGSYNSPQGTPNFVATEVTIPEYGNAIVKNVNWRVSYISNPATPAGNSGFGSGHWRSTSAITSVTLTMSTGTFASGTTINLYGVTAGNA